VPLFGPGQAGHAGGSREFVADRFFVAPFRSDFVNEHDVVGLGDGDFLRVRGEIHGPYYVAFLTLRVKRENLPCPMALSEIYLFFSQRHRKDAPPLI
jgi:hypothetical protein